MANINKVLGPNSTLNNYDAVDGAVREITLRHEAENKIRRSHALHRIFKWASIFAIAVAIALWIIFYAYRAMNAPYLDPEKVVNESRAKQELQNVVTGIIVENYVKFTEIPTGFPTFKTVTIGREFLNEFSVNPTNQWCYTNKEALSKITPRVDLASKSDNNTQYYSYNLEQMDEIGLTPIMAQKMQNLCRFD